MITGARFPWFQAHPCPFQGLFVNLQNTSRVAAVAWAPEIILPFQGLFVNMQNTSRVTAVAWAPEIILPFQGLFVNMQNASRVAAVLVILKCSTVWLQARVSPDFRLIPALKLLLSTYFAGLRYYLGSLLPWNPRISTSETFYCTCLGFQRHAFPYCPVCLCPEIYLTTHFSWSVIMNAW